MTTINRMFRGIDALGEFLTQVGEVTKRVYVEKQKFMGLECRLCLSALATIGPNHHWFELNHDAEGDALNDALVTAKTAIDAREFTWIPGRVWPIEGAWR